MTSQSSQQTYTIAVAGSTSRTLACSKTILEDKLFRIVHILTPEPKIVGRDTHPTPNALHQYALENDIPVTLVSSRIDHTTQAALEPHREKLDLLLVVDFGYLVPDWLLALPRIAALNIHPSALPAWRGSSPGQFTLLYGQKHSAITIQRMVKELDAGPIITQIPFEVESFWTQTEYYHTSFDLLQPHLSQAVYTYAQSVEAGNPQEIAQGDSHTPIARRLSKDDGYISFELIQSLRSGLIPTQTTILKQSLSPLLFQALKDTNLPLAQIIEQAIRAFSPWPTLWTLVPTSKGKKRMKLLSAKLASNQEKTQLILEKVQLEGQQPALWNQIKNTVVSN